MRVIGGWRWWTLKFYWQPKSKSLVLIIGILDLDFRLDSTSMFDNAGVCSFFSEILMKLTVWILWAWYIILYWQLNREIFIVHLEFHLATIEHSSRSQVVWYLHALTAPTLVYVIKFLKVGKVSGIKMTWELSLSRPVGGGGRWGYVECS